MIQNYLDRLIKEQFNVLPAKSNLLDNYSNYHCLLKKKIAKSYSKKFNMDFVMKSYNNYKNLTKINKLMNIEFKIASLLEKLDNRIEKVNKKYCKSLFKKEIKLTKKKINRVFDSSINEIDILIDYFLFQYNKKLYSLRLSLDNYIELEKEILDNIKTINDKNTRLRKVKKSIYLNKLNALYDSLSVDNMEMIENEFYQLRTEIIQNLSEEEVRIEKQIEEINLLYNTISLSNNEKKLLNNIEINHIKELKHKLLVLKADVADSEYILDKFIMYKTEYYRFIRKIQTRKNNKELLDKSKADIIRIIKAFKDYFGVDKPFSNHIEKINKMKKGFTTDLIQKSYELFSSIKIDLITYINL